MKRIKIFNLEPDRYADEALKILGTFADVTNGPCARTDIIKNLNGCDVLIVRLAHRIDRTLIENIRSVKVIASATTGLDHIDLTAAQEHGINIISLKGDTDFLETIHATAEHTWGLILALLRHIPAAHDHARHGGWNRDLFRGRELHGKTLGIVGLGRLGLKIAGYGLAFGMNVLANDILTDLNIPSVELCALNDLIARSDVISIHVPYDESTQKLIGAAQIGMMKKDAILINTSRGGVIDEKALLDALISGKISGAALDVLNGEPDIKNHPLLVYAAKHENLILTPHIGGATIESMAKAEIRIAEKIRDFFLRL